MRRGMLVFVVFAAAMVTSPGSHAEEGKLLVVGNIDVAFKNLTFNPGGVARQTTPLTTINPNIVLAYDNWYGSISYDGALAAGSISVIENGYPAVLSLSRSDFLLTFGYRVASPVSIFGGWLSGNINALQSGIRQEGVVLKSVVQTINYLEQGPFFGAAYSMSMGKKSSLNFSAAYANLTGSLNEKSTKINLSTTLAEPTTYSGRSFGVSGLSYGVTLTGELSNSMFYRAGIKATSYRGEPTAVDPVGIVEEYTSVFFGVTNYF